jgi:hypothetical protein
MKIQWSDATQILLWAFLTAVVVVVALYVIRRERDHARDQLPDDFTDAEPSVHAAKLHRLRPVTHLDSQG